MACPVTCARWVSTVHSQVLLLSLVRLDITCHRKATVSPVLASSATLAHTAAHKACPSLRTTARKATTVLRVKSHPLLITTRALWDTTVSSALRTLHRARRVLTKTQKDSGHATRVWRVSIATPRSDLLSGTVKPSVQKGTTVLTVPSMTRSTLVREAPSTTELVSSRIVKCSS